MQWKNDYLIKEKGRKEKFIIICKIKDLHCWALRMRHSHMIKKLNNKYKY